MALSSCVRSYVTRCVKCVTRLLVVRVRRSSVEYWINAMKRFWWQIEQVERFAVVLLVGQSILLFLANSISDQRSLFVDVFAIASLAIAILPFRRALARQREFTGKGKGGENRGRPE